MDLRTLEIGPFAVNCYLYWDDSTGDGVIIDPGAGAGEICNEIESAGFTPKAILLTHGYIGRGEEPLLANPSANVSAMIGQPIVVPAPEHVVADEQVINIGSLTFRILATPGHTPGGVCYLDETGGLLFCGDTLFQMSIGRTDLPGGSFETLIESINQKIMTLPDQIICYPGHGPQTTVGAERTNNPFLTGRYFA